MRKRGPSMEWLIVENDEEWERQQALFLSEVAPIISRDLRLQRSLWSIVTVCLLLISIGGWWHHKIQAKLQAAEAELHSRVQQEHQVVTLGNQLPAIRNPSDQRGREWWSQHAGEYSRLRAAIQATDTEVHLDIEGHMINIQGDQAVVQVISHTASVVPAYRQTRFYRHTGTSWLPTPPDASFWGPERSLETPYFVFHFAAKDEVVVFTVLPQLTLLYTSLWHNFGLTIAPLEKLIIDVRVTQSPGQTSLFDTAHHVSVASPALYWAPVDLTEAELLAQSLVLPLVADGLVQARTHHAIDQRWQPLLDGLYLWQLWDLALPLSVWREEIVKWLALDLPTTRPGQPVKLPDRYSAFCTAHRLWMASPVQMHIPLLCAELDHPGWWTITDFPTHLSTLAFLSSSDGYITTSSHYQASPPGQTVALATLIEYAVATYGRERLPVLMAGLGQYTTWETLLPAVFGVSAAEFEVGWQRYLAEHYGVPLTSVGVYPPR